MLDALNSLATGLELAGAGIALAERVAVLAKPDASQRATRLRIRAGRLMVRASTAKKRRRVKLEARAAALLKAASSIDASA